MVEQTCPQYQLALVFCLRYFLKLGLEIDLGVFFGLSRRFFLAVSAEVVKSRRLLFRRAIAANLHGCEQDHHSFMSEETA